MNKKIFPLMVAGTLLVGCGSSSAVNYSSEVSDGDKAVITIDDTKINKNEIYHYLLEQYGSSEVLSLSRRGNPASRRFHAGTKRFSRPPQLRFFRTADAATRRPTRR